MSSRCYLRWIPTSLTVDGKRRNFSLRKRARQWKENSRSRIGYPKPCDGYEINPRNLSSYLWFGMGKAKIINTGYRQLFYLDAYSVAFFCRAIAFSLLLLFTIMPFGGCELIYLKIQGSYLLTELNETKIICGFGYYEMDKQRDVFADSCWWRSKFVLIVKAFNLPVVKDPDLTRGMLIRVLEEMQKILCILYLLQFAKRHPFYTLEEIINIS